MVKIRFIIIFVIVLINNSCLDRHFIDGRAELISVSDTLLKDSSIVYGHIYHVDMEYWTYYRKNEFEIWIENSNLKTTNDSAGNYFLKINPGTYTIKCQVANNIWDRLIEEMKNIELQKNKKTQLNFFIGYTVE